MRTAEAEPAWCDLNTAIAASTVQTQDIYSVDELTAHNLPWRCAIRVRKREGKKQTKRETEKQREDWKGGKRERERERKKERKKEI